MANRFAAIDQDSDLSYVVYLADAGDVIPKRAWRGAGTYDDARDFVKAMKPPARLVPVGVLRNILRERRSRRE